MTNIVITGSDGFLGWHLRCRFHAFEPSANITTIDHSSFADDRLEKSLLSADAVIHLAAVNSHDATLASENDDISNRLVQALKNARVSPRIVIANSTHALRDSPYGHAKRRSVDTLRNWADTVGAEVKDVLLPNLFGEGGRPFTNSVIATMCESLISGTALAIDQDGHTELLHSQDAAQHLIDACLTRSHSHSSELLSGQELAVPELFSRLTDMFHTYSGTNVIPTFRDRFGLQLFNQLRFAMYPNSYPVSLSSGRDSRGVYTELARSFEGSQVSASTTNPGSVRGEHFHFDKVERFAVVAGQATVQVRRLLDNQVLNFELSGQDPTFIDIPTLHTHNLINSGKSELVTVFWSNDHFDPAHPDTFIEKVNESARS